jgi:hypothetical protein
MCTNTASVSKVCYGKSGYKVRFIKMSLNYVTGEIRTLYSDFPAVKIHCHLDRPATMTGNLNKIKLSLSTPCRHIGGVEI